METLNEQDVIEEARQIYHPNQVVEAIDLGEASRLGRGLSDRGFRIMAGAAVRHGLGQTVDQLLYSLDYSQKYQRYLEIHPNSLAGPHYITRPDGSEFCTHGIGVWALIERE